MTPFGGNQVLLAELSIVPSNFLSVTLAELSSLWILFHPYRQSCLGIPFVASPLHLDSCV